MTASIPSNKRIAALASLYEVDPSDITPTPHDDKQFTIAQGYEKAGDYLILTNREANAAVKEHIMESLWAFRTDFIMRHTNLPAEAGEMLAVFQEEKCEDANSTIRALIRNKDLFIKNAVEADGRGHFLSPYDGVEDTFRKSSADWLNQQIKPNGPEFFVYRIN